MLDIILAPDVYVNASVALGSPPDKVVQRVLGQHKGESKTTEWILDRVKAMLGSIPTFKKDLVEDQIALIRQFVQVIEDPEKHGPGAWDEALTAAAKAAGVGLVVTDHPDLLALGSKEDIGFVSTENWLLEFSIPPPVPVKKD